MVSLSTSSVATSTEGRGFRRNFQRTCQTDLIFEHHARRVSEVETIPPRHAVFAEPHICHGYQRANACAHITCQFGIVLSNRFPNFLQCHYFAFHNLISLGSIGLESFVVERVFTCDNGVSIVPPVPRAWKINLYLRLVVGD